MLRLIFSTLLINFFIGFQFLAAQENEQPFVVTYIEVLPGYEEDVSTLLSQISYFAREHAGNLRYQALQRIGRPNHFAIIETWADLDSINDFKSQGDYESYRSTLEYIIYSPYDERPSTAVFDTENIGYEGEIYAVTHIDIIPTALEEGRVIINDLVKQTRLENGSLEVAIMEQNNRRNHFTLVETWLDEPARVLHQGTEHVSIFREALLPRSGSLYDERLYRLIN
ncbi:MAG: putative quinol monooxygenase [Gammaproteobacteria bacterium]